MGTFDGCLKEIAYSNPQEIVDFPKKLAAEAQRKMRRDNMGKAATTEKMYNILFCVLVGLSVCILAVAVVCFVMYGSILMLLSAAMMILYIALCFALRRSAYAN